MAWPDTVRKEDVEVKYYRGSGAGGQNRNKRDTACRMRHRPTGITAQAQEMRTREGNRKACWKRLATQLVPLMIGEKPHRRRPMNRVRTYHEPRQTVKDHRTGKTASFQRVLDGELDLLR